MSLAGDPGGPFGVGAAMAGFAGYAAVRAAEAVELARILGEPLVGGDEGGGRRIGGIIGLHANEVGAQMVEGVAGMAGLALGHILPGPSLGPGGAQVDPQGRVVDVREIWIYEAGLSPTAG